MHLGNVIRRTRLLHSLRSSSALKRLPINYSSSLIGLFLSLSGSLVTLASFFLVLHLAAPSPGCWVSQLSIPLNGLALHLTLRHSEAPSPTRTFSRPLAVDIPWTRAVYSGFVTLLCTAQIPAGTVVACSTRLHQTSSIDMIRLVVACIRHDAHDSTVRCFTSFNCKCCNAASTESAWTKSDVISQAMHVVSLLGNCSLVSNSAISLLRFLLACCEQASKLQSAVLHFRHC